MREPSEAARPFLGVGYAKSEEVLVAAQACEVQASGLGMVPSFLRRNVAASSQVIPAGRRSGAVVAPLPAVHAYGLGVEVTLEITQRATCEVGCAAVGR